MKISFEIEIVERLSNDAIARVHYPSDPEGPKIQIIKGLNAIEVSRAIHHEIGHALDWYFGQSDNVEIREQNADIIGESIRFRENSK